jgi:hypothetical protein
VLQSIAFTNKSIVDNYTVVDFQEAIAKIEELFKTEQLCNLVEVR